MPTPTPRTDPFGFKFWLTWILGFCGSFFLTAFFWTELMTIVFHKIQGRELTITWCVGVFGSWFMILTPFMRKKEQIWKRLNVDQEKAVDVWLLGMGIFIGFLIVSAFAWSWIYRAEISVPGTFNSKWAKAVFSSWLVLALPLLVFLYKQADQIFKSAVIRQTREGPLFRTQFVPREKRMLDAELGRKVKMMPETMERGHVAKIQLKDGRMIPHAFILDGRELLGLYDYETFNFSARDIEDVIPLSAEELIPYDPAKWLRLDVKI
ncbi:MAG: hypothetical protein EXS63_08015 [Candidatus Omnitrophica bacterium]|nr:hypothetical protein [Candidatus Omnitrophota bacterium]